MSYQGFSESIMINGTPIPKEKKGVKLGTWRKKCDAIMQQIGHHQNPFCLICGQTQQVMHHFFPKSVSARLRYEWDNLIPLCNGCHNRLHQSGDPSYEQRIIEKKGKEWYDRLNSIRREVIKVNVEYYRNIQKDLIELSTVYTKNNFTVSKK